MSLKTKSRTEGYQATELFDIGGTIAVKLSREEPTSVDVLLADEQVKSNPLVDEFGAVRELSKKFDATVWGETRRHEGHHHQVQLERRLSDHRRQSRRSASETQ